MSDELVTCPRCDGELKPDPPSDDPMVNDTESCAACGWRGTVREAWLGQQDGRYLEDGLMEPEEVHPNGVADCEMDFMVRLLPPRCDYCGSKLERLDLSASVPRYCRRCSTDRKKLAAAAFGEGGVEPWRIDERYLKPRNRRRDDRFRAAVREVIDPQGTK